VLRAVAAHVVAEGDRHCWYDPAAPLRIGLAKPTVDLMGALAKPQRVLTF
jgi:hypothetical protein